MLKYEQALDKMPHTGRMRLIERVVMADKTSIECIAADHAAESYPLLVEGVLYSTVLCELGAQAAAAHQSLYQMQGNHTGLLVALQNVTVGTDIVARAGPPLQVSATQLHDDHKGAIYAFSVHSHDGEILSGNAMLKLEGDRA